MNTQDFLSSDEPEFASGDSTEIITLPSIPLHMDTALMRSPEGEKRLVIRGSIIHRLYRDSGYVEIGSKS